MLHKKVRTFSPGLFYYMVSCFPVTELVEPAVTEPVEVTK